MFEPDRRYDDAMFDEQTGVDYSRLDGGASQNLGVEGMVSVGVALYLPHRRHLKPEALARDFAGVQDGIRELK